MVFCPKCGSDNPDDSLFCWKCGTKLVHDTDAIGVSSELQPEPVPEPEVVESAPDKESAPEPEPAVECQSTKEAVHVALEASTYKPPEKKSNTKTYAIAVIVLVIIAAMGAGIYLAINDDGESSYSSVWDLPEDHPLYGVGTPDGDYVYDATVRYQGQTLDAVISVGIQDERFTYYAIDGEMLPSSSLDEINQSSSASFTISDVGVWNDGTENHDIYKLDMGLYGVNYVADDGTIVYSEGETDGMYIAMTLRGWTEGEIPENYLKYTILDRGDVIASGTVAPGSLMPEPDYTPVRESYVTDGYVVKGTGIVWDFDSDKVTYDISIEVHWIQHFISSYSGGTATVKPVGIFEDMKVKVDWGDKSSITGYGEMEHVYDEVGDYSITVTSTDDDGMQYVSGTSLRATEAGYTYQVYDNGQLVRFDTVAEGSKIPKTMMTRNGYIFEGYRVNSTGQMWDFDNDVVNSDLVMTVVWKHHFDMSVHDNIVTINFVDDFEKMRSSVEWTTNSTTYYDEGDVPKHAYSELGNQHIVVRSIEDTSSWTSYASFSVYSAQYYDVEFYVNGILYDSQNVRSGLEVERPADPSATDGYMFVGWRVDGTNKFWSFTTDTPMEDTKLVADFTQVFEISVNGNQVRLTMLNNFVNWNASIQWGDGISSSLSKGGVSSTHTYDWGFQGRITVTLTSGDQVEGPVYMSVTISNR